MLTAEIRLANLRATLASIGARAARARELQPVGMLVELRKIEVATVKALEQDDRDEEKPTG